MRFRPNGTNLIRSVSRFCHTSPIRFTFLFGLLLSIAGFPLCPAHGNPLKEIFEKATDEYNKGNFEEALNLYLKTLEIYPQFAPSYFYIGLTQKAMGKSIQEVVKSFEQAVTLDPHYAEAYDNLSKLYYGLAEFDKAEQAGLRAVQANPGLTTAQLSLGWIYLIGLADAQTALPYFEKVIETQEDFPYAYFGLGLCYFLTNKRIEMMDMITRLRQTGKEDLAIQLEQMLREKNPAQAIKQFIPFATVQQSREHKGLTVSNLSSDSLTSSHPIGNYSVRLKRNLPADAASPVSSQTALTGAERIRQLQSNQIQGLGY